MAYRVLRGGSWNNDNTNNLRASNRNRNNPTNTNDNNGFRCAAAQCFFHRPEMPGVHGRRDTAKERNTPCVPARQHFGEGPKSAVPPRPVVVRKGEAGRGASIVVLPRPSRAR